ncbi:hypothetical protein PCANB_000156 [Pneumocystis canis]|nr:hypothetical protein PCANB_000156 [Pneumocystis canis]
MTFFGTIPSISPICKCISLKSKKRKEAFELLKKIESFVNPIMSRRGWKVGVLAEFFPKNGTLLGLNVNKGSKIYIRLRTCDDENIFYPLDYLIEIMLHELAHNVHGPHDAKFYGMIFLNSEFTHSLCFDHSQDGFYSQGYRLDNYVSHDNSYFKKRVLDSKQSNTLTGCHELRLGGNENIQNKPLRDLIRDAAEKRIKNLKWCGSELSITIEDNEIFEEYEEQIPFKKLLKTNSNLNNPLPEKKTIMSEYESCYKTTIPEKSWSSSFTFKNNENYLECGSCLLEHSSNASKFNTEWECIICSYVNQKHQFSCEFCNTIKT